MCCAGGNTGSNTGTDSTASGTPNTAPLPNPWAGGGAGAGAGAAPAGDCLSLSNMYACKKGYSILFIQYFLPFYHQLIFMKFL